MGKHRAVFYTLCQFDAKMLYKFQYSTFLSRFYSLRGILGEILSHKKAAAQNLHNSLSILQQLFFRCNDLQKIPMKLFAA